MFSQKVYINYMILIISHKLGYVITYALKNKKKYGPKSEQCQERRFWRKPS